MNKKRLSVVMAGAMLASSVAPVLAAETTTQKDYEVNGSNRGLLIKSLRELILTKGTFTNVTANDELAGHSVHYVTIDRASGKVDGVGVQYATIAAKLNAELKKLGIKEKVDGNTEIRAIANKAKGKRVGVITKGNAVITVEFPAGKAHTDSANYTIVSKYDNKNIADLETAIQKAKADTKLRVWDAGHIEKDGKIYGKTLEDTHKDVLYTKDSLKAEADAFKAEKNPLEYPAVLDMEFDGKVLTVKTRLVGEETEASRKVLTYKENDAKVNFKVAIDDQKNPLMPNFEGFITENIFGFAKVEGEKIPEKTDIEDKELYTVTITDVDNEQTVVLSELYNGLFLTEKGEELLNAMKEYDAKDNYSVDETPVVDKTANGLYTVTLTFKKTVNKEKIKNVVKITTNDFGKIEFFAKGLKAEKAPGHKALYRKFPVQKLVGATRHETAVKVARENADIRTVAENGNIVLVNSDSLVDGLAAAPLAASAINLKDGVTSSITDKDYVAPILLTNRDGLDKVTKDYIKEVVAHQRVGNLDKVTVYLVGGEAVISKAVENDLKEAGLRVIRAGGKDREATSLRVAELITKDNGAKFDSAFLVGATGEADAMSVASVAADTTLKSTGKKVTPIIVESVHGISEDTIDYLRGYKQVDTGKNVTIIGGEKVVSKATEETLKAELKGKAVERVQGANRKETNAKVISTFYELGSLSHILVSKDGIARKGELIDALTATSIAAKYHTPIVLGTNELTKSQIEAIEDASNRKADKYVYQIGGNVAESVVRTIAERLSLAK